MIANARMYAVSPEVSGLWRRLLAAVIERSGLTISLVEHAEPAPIDTLWRREDKAAVLMCGLPFARGEPRADLVAAPVPSPADFHSMPQYWSELVVRETSPYRSIDQTFGRRLAFTVPDSQSGCVAALRFFMTLDAALPLFQEIIAPQVTPLGAITAVLEGHAEIAPVDSYAFALFTRYRPDLTSRLRVIARTMPTPIPAFVASPGTLSQGALESLRSAFLEAHRHPLTEELMGRLLLQRFELPLPDSYAALRDGFEAATGYWGAHPLATVADPAFQW